VIQSGGIHRDDLTWVREETPVWDADKQRVIGGAPEGAFDLPFAEGDPLPGEWWSARDGETVVGYGRLDIGWGGDAEILLAVDPARQEEGIGTFVLGALEGEALRRGINYVYNVVPDHPERIVVHDWFVIRGFRGPIDGDLRKRLGARPGVRRTQPATDAPYDPASEGDHGPGDEESGGYVDIDDHQY
jgi:GNAT superfamily N-acetyltransferase